ncbi:multidrug/pheromone exporter, ABC superfamily [Mollisia scopiformis]|uniref:Multidrug/pheromone exporter, ABC superfamily n=1 Tax=Mollisia scopiformis TaxID=149040 RepID=A0A194XME9_MOLSC|nr:multidrug/pheromone exporter, ABC superfamily [Mollisia scopiformis]KUJ21301.1 multidrug/pheromone exporter, ABC superfamily [Mollisia scopiformis]
MGSEKMEDRSEKVTSIASKEGINHKTSSSNGEVTLNPDSSEKWTRSHLTEDEKRILDRQIDAPAVKASWFMLFRYATKVDLAIIALAAFCAIAAGAAFPLMTVVFGQLTTTFARFFQNATTSADIAAFRHEISKLSLYFVYIAIGSFTTIYIATVGFIYTGEHITQKLREQYLAAVLRQNIAYFDKLGAGEITTRITSDMVNIQGGISEKVGLTLTGVSTFVVAIIVGFIKDWRLTLILFSVVFCIVFSMGGFSRFMIKFQKESQAYSGVGASLAEEVFSSIRNATALGTQDRLADEYDGYLLKAEKGGFKMKTVAGSMLGMMMFIMFCDYALAFWQGSRYLVKGEIVVGHIITILLAMMMGSMALGQVAPHAQAFGVAIAAGGPIYSLIDRPTSQEEVVVGEKIPSPEGAIELRGVKHVYPSRQEVVVMNDVDLVIPAGKVTALVGASGSGKSTIIGLIERFYPPVAGQVLLDGQDIQTLDLKWLRQQISLVSQEPVLFRTSVYGNIVHGLIGSPMENASDEKKMELVIEAAKMSNAHEFISSLPEGYDTDVGERGFLMSGGQKQRIAIARAVISDPKILLLDEATSALDTKSEGVVQAALDAASKGRTTVVIAHRLSTIKGADNIVVMAEGSIIEQGTHDELVERKGAYVQLLDAQKMVAETLAHHDEDTDEEPTTGTLEKTQTRATTASEGMVKPTRTMTSKSLYDQRDETRDSDFNYTLWEMIKFVSVLNRKELPVMLFGIFCSILGGAANPLQAVYMGHCISALSRPASQYGSLRHDIDFWALMFFITGIVILLAFSLQAASFGYGSERLIFYARSKAIRAMLRQDISFFDRPENSSGALVSMLSTEVTGLAGISGATLGSILSALTTIILALAIACAINYKLGLVCATAMPVLICCGFLRFWVLAQFQLRARRAYETSASFACEATAAIRTIASLTREDQVWDLYHDMLHEQTRKSLRSVLQTSTLYAASQAGMFCASALGFWWGGTLISRHEISMQGFFICFASVIFGAQATGGIFSHAPDMGKSRQAADALKTLFDRKPEIDIWSEDGEKVQDVQGAIEFRDVHFRYPTRIEQPVLRGIDLKFEPGQYVALVGPSGCGKSTVVSLIERFYDPRTGGVFLDGKDISTLNLREYRSRIALVSQEPVLYSGTIRENIVSGAAEHVDEEVVVKACRDANIHEFITSLPDGLNTLVGSKGVMLSGGQKQRIAIARALIRDPKILLLDEATSALDSTSECIVQEALDKAAKGRTTIAIAHRLSTVQNADVIYVLEGGRVVESGDHKSLMEGRGRYFELVRLQGLRGKE